MKLLTSINKTYIIVTGIKYQNFLYLSLCASKPCNNEKEMWITTELLNSIDNKKSKYSKKHKRKCKADEKSG